MHAWQLLNNVRFVSCACALSHCRSALLGNEGRNTRKAIFNVSNVQGFRSVQKVPLIRTLLLHYKVLVESQSYRFAEFVNPALKSPMIFFPG